MFRAALAAFRRDGGFPGLLLFCQSASQKPCTLDPRTQAESCSVSAPGFEKPLLPPRWLQLCSARRQSSFPGGPGRQPHSLSCSLLSLLILLVGGVLDSQGRHALPGPRRNKPLSSRVAGPRGPSVTGLVPTVPAEHPALLSGSVDTHVSSQPGATAVTAPVLWAWPAPLCLQAGLRLWDASPAPSLGIARGPLSLESPVPLPHTWPASCAPVLPGTHLLDGDSLAPSFCTS